MEPGAYQTPPCSTLGGIPPKLDQARLVLGQLQPELREPFTKVYEEPLGVTFVLEPHHDIVGETHDDDVTVRVASSPLVGPQVEDKMQVDVAEQR